MRRCYLVAYDIADPKRLRRIFSLLKGYGDHWQLSVFFCVLKELDRIRLQSDLECEMNIKEDRLMIVDLGENEEHARKAITSLGSPPPEPDPSLLVI